MYRILYVDDEPALLEIARIFLEQSGAFQVETITSAPAAITLMKQASFDAIISDYQMPEMDGIAFLAAVREQFRDIPFILFTGRGREAIVIQAIEGGADFYLQKGGDPRAQFAELEHKVRQAIARRRAEHDRTESEKRLLDIINFLPDATFAIDKNGIVIAWNHAMETMTGIPAQEMLGKGDHAYAIPFYHERRPILIDLVLNPDEQLERSRYLLSVHERSTLAAEAVIEHPGGDVTHIWGIASRLFNEKGDLAGSIESIRDITEQKKMGEALRETEERFAVFMDHLPVTAFIKDADSTNLYINRHMEEVFGNRNWLGQSVYEQFPRDAAEKMVADDRKTIQEGFRKIVETVPDKDGIPRAFETYKFRMDRLNKPPLIGGFSIDITERNDAEEALRDSEERFRKIFENSPLGMTLVGPDLRFVSVNPAFIAMTGYSREELLHLTFGDITHPDHRASDTEQMQNLAGGILPTYSTEKRYLRKDGSILRGWVRVTTIRDRQGSIRYFAAQIEDITERRRAEEALRESEEKYRELLENANSIILKWDRNGRITFFNEYAQRFFGYTHEEIMGKSVLGTIVPATESGSDRDLNAMIDNILQHPEDFAFNENENITRDGRRVWIRWQNKTLLDENGGFSGLFSIGTDITESKKTEAALRESEENFRDLYDNAPYAYYSIDVEGRISQCNRLAEVILGVPREDLIGRKIARFYADTTNGKEKARRLFAGFRQGREIAGEELQMKRADGELIWINLTVNAIRDSSGTIIGSRTIVTDISRHKHAEDALRIANHKLQLLAGVTRHDIRNQILTMRTAIDLIGTERSDQNTKKYLGIAGKAVDAIENQIGFTKEYEHIGLKDPRWQNAGEVFHRAARNFLLSDISLTVTGSNYEVLADPLLEKVFSDLIDNALRHGGNITAIDLSSRETMAGLTLILQDNGRGVSEGEKQLIFERGFGRNTGLGLFFAREILSLTGITIGETGEEGAGARFEILVPKGLYRRAVKGPHEEKP